MNDIDKSKEVLLAEIVDLRQELEKSCIREKQPADNDWMTDGEQCKKLVSEVPEYLYSIEFNNGKITATFHSRRCEEITGYSPREFNENPYLWINMIHKEDRERVLDFIKGLSEPLNCKSIEHRIIHKNGSVRWVVNMSTVHLDTEGAVLRQSGFLIDVTEHREAEDRNLQLFNENRHNSLFDGLTGLYNRRGFWELGEQQLRVAARINQPVLLFFIDVDKLKHTNDVYGHHAGDDLLIGLATVLKHTFRESDLIARIGGDEFTVLTMETGPDSNEVFFERLRANIEKKNKNASDAFALSVTAGASRYNLHDSDTITGLIDRADKDMYSRKKSKIASY
jgi:diguanylate cyclase (GGDEF)-like protein/PAS domain S-box-containing protein